MAIAIDVVRFNFQSELPIARSRAELLKWDLSADVEALSIRVVFEAADRERFILVGEFDDYKEKPPILEFEEPGTGVRGTPKAYPKGLPGKDSFFHSTGPCICAPFSRKAYKDVHKDWNFTDWMTSRASDFDWSKHSTMSGMLLLIHTRLVHPEYYGGRMG